MRRDEERKSGFGSSSFVLSLVWIYGLLDIDRTGRKCPEALSDHELERSREWEGEEKKRSSEKLERRDLLRPSPVSIFPRSLLGKHTPGKFSNNPPTSPSFSFLFTGVLFSLLSCLSSPSRRPPCGRRFLLIKLSEE